MNMNKTITSVSSPIPNNAEHSVRDEMTSTIPKSERVQISPAAYLRSMAVLFWTAIRYPFQTTEVDLRTGKVIRHF